MNPITLIDGYKVDHRRQYPRGTQRVFSNWTPRGSRVKGTTHVVNFGLQYFLQRYMEEEMDRFFNASRQAVLDRYARRLRGYLGPDAATTIGTDHIAALWEVQHMPLRFTALPEGTLVPLRVPPLFVENTHDDFFWLVNYIESLMSNILWMPLTSATTAYRYRAMFDRYADLTGVPPAFVQWQGHDFSFRGLAGIEAAMLSGAGHLLSFTGTDTIPALDLIEDYYGDDLPEDYLIGGSVPATEHSVMCAGGEANEQATIARLLDLYPTGILSVVSDTWDLWQVLTEYLPNLREQILARDGKLVIRPDSGDPVKILCGDWDAPEGTPESKGLVQLLWETFPGSFNAKGYKVLNPHVGSIYGDAITYERGEEICARLMRLGFSTEAVFGIGSFTYQYVTRDTYGLAMKATWCQIDGQPHSIFKKPRTDSGEKFSAKGRLAILPGNLDVPHDLTLVHEATPEEEARSLAQPVWENGAFLRRENFQTIRQRLHPGKF